MLKKLNNILGFYLPGFFRLHISTQNSIVDFNKLNDFDFSILLHEYIHFIQDITTYYCLNNIHSTVEYFRFVNNFIINKLDNEFEIPILPDPSNNDNVLLNSFLCNITFGYFENNDVDQIFSYKIENKAINIPRSPISEIEIVSVVFFDRSNIKRDFIFGAGCILESMSYILQKLTCKNYAISPDIPYLSAELLVEFIYPDFGKNLLNILALCDISLNISNPAKYFVLTLEEWKKKGIVPSSPKLLYDNFRNGNFKVNSIEVGNAVDRNFINMSNLAKSQLFGYFNDKRFDNLKKWIEEVIMVAQNLRLQNPYFILDIAEGNIRENKVFIEIFNKLGTPLLTNNNNEFRFYHPKAFTNQIDVGFFWAINQIQKIFFGYKTECELYEFCKQSKISIDNRCVVEPWKRCIDKDLCPFAIFWRHWGLSNYKPNKNNNLKYN